jgi:hypothetical protein
MAAGPKRQSGGKTARHPNCLFPRLHSFGKGSPHLPEESLGASSGDTYDKRPGFCGRGFFFKREIYFGAMPSTPMARKSEYFLPSLSHQGRTLSLKCFSLAALLGYWMMR